MLGCAEYDLSPLPAEVVSTGIPWLIMELSQPATISALAPDQNLILQECGALRAAGLTVFVEKPGDSTERLRVRTFAPGEGIPEDPVCGSGNGCVAAFLAERKHSGDLEGAYLAEQGVEIGRRGEVHASWQRDGDRLRIKIGGAAVTILSGQLHL
jgi:PhzF family phenazine biosynthesis protein